MIIETTVLVDQDGPASVDILQPLPGLDYWEVKYRGAPNDVREFLAFNSVSAAFDAYREIVASLRAQGAW